MDEPDEIRAASAGCLLFLKVWAIGKLQSAPQNELRTSRPLLWWPHEGAGRTPDAEGHRAARRRQPRDRGPGAAQSPWRAPRYGAPRPRGDRAERLPAARRRGRARPRPGPALRLRDAV